MSASSTYLENLLASVRDFKKAAGSGLDDPGGYLGKSTHPSAQKRDDNLMPLRTGARAAENEADVKRTIPSPNVDSQPDAKPSGGEGTPSQDKVQYNIGVTQSSTGQEPSVEDDYKDTHSDPGTTMPAKADRGEKYSALKTMPFDKLASRTSDLGNALLRDIVGRKTAAQPAASSAQPVTAAAPRQVVVSAEKRAASLQLIEATIKEAFTTADLVIDFIKGAEAPPDAPRIPKTEDPEGPQEMAPPMAGPGGPGGLPPGLAAAAEGGPGMDAPPEAGGAPPGPEEAVHELAAAFQDMGMTPEDVMAIAEKMHAAAAGAPGGPPSPGGMPGEDNPGIKMAVSLYKAAANVQRYKRSGRYGYAPPATKRAESIRSHMRATLAEMLGTR